MNDKINQLNDLKDTAFTEIKNAQSLVSLDNVRVQFLGKKGKLTEFLRGLGNVDSVERPLIGKAVNDVKKSISDEIDRSFSVTKKLESEKKFHTEKIDYTLPGKVRSLGKAHPIAMVLDEALRIFSYMGFAIKEGPEIESEHYNFEALNIPKLHPARDMQDTFYVDEDILLRTHTSPVQIHVMEKCDPPLRIVAPGKVYRRDSDITHSPMFHQIEGFMIDTDVSFADLKGVLTTFLKELFGEDTALRFRPSFFPFTEPSAEVDITCVMCNGKGCRICKGTGWIEILGAGMIHPEVFKSVGYDYEKYTQQI